jgi:pimeloyl-ACP methyl ester carboxylesterase
MPTTDRPLAPASRRALLHEVRAGLQLPRLLARSPRLVRMPRGTGGPVIDLPGWRTTEVSMAPLRRYLSWLGHDAHGWGLGRNVGDVGRNADRLAPLVRRLADGAGRPVSLVGWSLGGIVAREAARRLGPELVSQVITLGSPVVGGPAYTSVAGPMTDDQRTQWVDRVEEIERASPLTIPVTSIFTRRDGVVPWQASLDHHSADVTHIEVGSTHFSLGVDPDVWEIVARLLAAQR